VSGTAPLLRVDVIRNKNRPLGLARADQPRQAAANAWGQLYQRRAATGLRSPLTPSGGTHARGGESRPGFEECGSRPMDRLVHGPLLPTTDGVLVDTAEVSGGSRGWLDDAGTMGVIETDIPLGELDAKGHWEFKQEAPNVQHPYLKAMGVAPAFFVHADVVDINGPMDSAFEFTDRMPIKPGDYFYLRLEQLDANKAWSSPVWVN
jgi:hypothetical protein